ncbi:DUF6249 domain-containing protein [soil metagenome]
MHDGFVPLVFFTFLAVVIVVPQILKSRDRQRMYEVMRAAYDKGQPVPPDMMAAMTTRDRDVEEAYYATPVMQSHRDLRRGIVWLSVGIGLFVIGGLFYAGLYNDGGAAETAMTFGAFGAIPFCIGLAFMALWFFTRGKRF